MRCRNKSLSLLCFLAFAALSCAAQTASLESIKNLYDRKQWDEVVRAVAASPDTSADLDYYRGLALAQLQRWPDAKASFEAGLAKEPHSERFLVELAGVAYRTQRLDEAKRKLRAALCLDPHDSYALNFLGTIYLLEGNLEASLKYWNHVEKPRISIVQSLPQPELSPDLFDRAIVVSPLSVMRRSQFELSEANIAALGVFPIHHWELQPQTDESYNLVFHSIEQNGWGANKWAAALEMLRGLPYETAYPEFRNGGGRAINFDSLIRWDSQKRRLFASVSMPLEGTSRWSFQAHIDGRDENWNLTNSFAGAALPLAEIRLRKIELGAGIRRIETGRWSWQTGASFSRRTFGNVTGIDPAAAKFFASGSTVKWNARTDYRILALPERRFTVDTKASASAGEFFATSSTNGFARIEGGARADWFPQAQGDDYEIASQFRAGAIAGTVPLDEFFTLGAERDDNDLWLRGISATRGGQKGNSPMGRRYVLWNWEWNKVVYKNAFFEFKVGPIFDAGRVSDSSGFGGSQGWRWDPGAQVKVRVLDTIEVVFSYGRDIRSGQNAFFGAALR